MEYDKREIWNGGRRKGAGDVAASRWFGWGGAVVGDLKEDVVLVVMIVEVGPLECRLTDASGCRVFDKVDDEVGSERRPTNKGGGKIKIQGEMARRLNKTTTNHRLVMIHNLICGSHLDTP